MVRQGEDWVDVTYAIKEGMVHWPGQPPVSFERLSEMEKGDSATVSALSLSLHTGTHMDAPKHFLPHASDITTAPVSALMGALRVAVITDVFGVDEDALRAYEARTRRIEASERVFFRTKNSDTNWLDTPFNKDYVAILPSGARYLAARGVQVVGVDYLSVAPFNNTTETHEVLLSAGVWVIEGLDLRAISEGDYEMIALPLKIETGDASPLRVVIRPKR